MVMKDPELRDNPPNPSPINALPHAAGAISAFVNRHPTVKMLALSFLLLIGVTLMLEGFDQHVPKGYIYFAMAFSVGVEMLNMAKRNRRARAARTQAEG